MKIIDLLNKIANGENIKNIKYDNRYFIFNEEKDNYYENETCSINWDYVSLHCLNEEVEIIEEEKKIPERIQSNGENLYSEYIGQWLVNKENYTEYDELLMNKINEIIDYLKSKGE